MSLTLHEISRRLKGFDIHQEVKESIIETSDAVKALNQEQLSKGETSDSRPIVNRFTRRDTYSIWWGEYRESLGLQTKFFDLKVTGEWQNEIQIDKMTDTTFNITSKNRKTKDIEKMFGEKVLGLSDQNRSKYIPNNFFPELKQRIEGKLGFKMS